MAGAAAARLGPPPGHLQVLLLRKAVIGVGPEVRVFHNWEKDLKENWTEAAPIDMAVWRQRVADCFGFNFTQVRAAGGCWAHCSSRCGVSWGGRDAGWLGGGWPLAALELAWGCLLCVPTTCKLSSGAMFIAAQAALLCAHPPPCAMCCVALPSPPFHPTASGLHQPILSTIGLPAHPPSLAPSAPCSKWPPPAPCASSSSTATTRRGA